MKILMVLESDFPPDIRVENEIDSLVESGHKIHIACYSHKKQIHVPPDLNYSIHKKYIPGFIYKSSVGALKFDFYFNFWRRFLGELIEEHSFDAIHIHDLPLALIGAEFQKKYSIKYALIHVKIRINHMQSFYINPLKQVNLFSNCTYSRPSFFHFPGFSPEILYSQPIE